MLNRRIAAVALTAAAVVAVPSVATAASAAPAAASHSASTQARHGQLRLVLTGGVTMLKLDPATAGVLTQNGIAVAPVSSAKVGESGIAFPIQGGIIDPATLGGSFTHAGGLKFTAGGKSLTIRDFTVNTVNGTLTAWVDEVGARIPVLDLNLSKVSVALGRTSVNLRGVTATLNGTAASALNDYFGTTLFAKGLSIGSVRVSAKFTPLRTA